METTLMKTKLLLAVACLLLFAASGQAQVEPPRVMVIQQESGELRELTAEEFRRMEVDAGRLTRRISPEESFFSEQSEKAHLKGLLRSAWNGRGTGANLIIAALATGGYREADGGLSALGMSEEQIEQLTKHVTDSMEGRDDRSGDSDSIIPKAIRDEMATLQNDGEFDTDAQERVRSIIEKHMETEASRRRDTIADAVDEILPAEQIQQIQESILANMAGMPFITTSVFEVLNLTDGQRQQMERIKKELEPAFEEILECWVNVQLTLHNTKDAEGREYQRIYDDIQSKGKAFAVRFRTRMFDVLNDNQWARLQKLVDNSPEHALILRKKLKELSGEGEESKGGKKADVWVPGPGAWQPGQGIPEGYRQERNSRFPRGENPSP